MRVVRSGVVVPDRFVFHITAAPGSYRPMVIRGVAEIDEDYEAPPDGLVPALDLAFAGTSRFAKCTNIRTRTSAGPRTTSTPLSWNA